MSNKVKDLDVECRTYHFFNDMINMKSFDANHIKIDKKSSKNILNLYVGYVTIKNVKYVKINRVNSLYLIFGKVDGYFKEINGKKYLSLVTTNESKEIMKKYEELWNKIRDLIRSITKK